MDTGKQLEGRRLQLVTFLVTGSMFMEVLDGNIIATALPEMSRSFGVDALQLNIAISAYLLALGVFIPVSGWIADRFGPRRVFTSAIACFTLTSVACGLVDHLPLFLVLRILQGASGALMVPVGRLLVLRYTPQSRRMAAMSNLVWPALTAPVIAPPLGGFIVKHASWHWIFFLNLPLGLIAFVLALRLIPALEPAPRRRFDWLGFALFGLGIFALLSSLEGLVANANLANLALLGGGITLLAGAVVHFQRSASPMLTLTPLRIPTFRAAMVGGSIMRMAIGSLPFLLPLMFQIGFGFNAFHSGLLLLVVFAGNLSMKAVTTPILRRFGYRPVMLWNGLLAAACLGLCALIGPTMPMGVLMPILFFCGMTRSMQFTCLGTIAFADVPDRQMADANGLFNVISQVGMAAGITLGAMAVRLGGALSEGFHFTAPAIQFRMAFLLISVIALAGLLDTLRLPKGAGDHFVART
ncbi:MFS transporter [Variovorax sp. Sphag1AA]|uniref:MFS transporter n=1 Tax=Variovorax sp. Sphag1AA TaxID=2587027 RepID=UPI0016214246|nr:MFS transporter [Variovorax sp. Sphag1AA]MBB3181871.1 EmrB/QacA subfamily drug resistance transporter [Variovorax sp. Sphag1AA]